jgi:hypothetical protein
MCAGGDLMEKTHTEAAQLLQKISKAAAMQRDWETRLSGNSECDTSVRPLAGIFRNTVPEEKKEEPIPKKVVEIKHAEARTIPESDHAERSKASERTMSSMKPLREFKQMDWVSIDFGEIFDKRRSFPNQKGMAKAVEKTFRRRNMWNNHTTYRQPGRSFKNSLVKKMWIRTMWLKRRGLWESSPRHHHLLASIKFTP